MPKLLHRYSIWDQVVHIYVDLIPTNKVHIERPRVVNYHNLGGMGIRCVHYIEKKDCTAGLDAGGI